MPARRPRFLRKRRERRLLVERLEQRLPLDGALVDLGLQHDANNLCKEKDNLHISGRSQAPAAAAPAFQISAYPAGAEPAIIDDEMEDFEFCDGFDDGTGAEDELLLKVERGPYTLELIHNDGNWVDDMTAVVEGQPIAGVTYFRWYKQAAPGDSPQFWVHYADSAIRLAALTSPGGFGASVLAGPIGTRTLPTGEVRGLAQIATVSIPDAGDPRATVNFLDGGSATLTARQVDGQRTTLDVAPNYSGAEIFRIISMHVPDRHETPTATPLGDIESDVSHVLTRDAEGAVAVSPVQQFSPLGNVRTVAVAQAVNSNHGAYSGGVEVTLDPRLSLGAPWQREYELMTGEGAVHDRSTASGDGVTEEHRTRQLRPGQSASATFTPRWTGDYVLLPRASRGELSDSSAALRVTGNGVGQTRTVALPSTHVAGTPLFEAWNRLRYAGPSEPVFLHRGLTYTIETEMLGAADEGADFDVLTAMLVGDPRPALAVEPALESLREDASTTAPIRVADVVVEDDGRGQNLLSLAGADAALFELDAGGLFLKAGAALDHQANPELNVTVLVDDPAAGDSPDDFRSLTIAVLPALHWHNGPFPADVNGDAVLTGEDLRDAFAYLVTTGPGPLDPAGPPRPGLMIDVEPNLLFDAEDVRRVFVRLLLSTTAPAEAEPPDELASAPAARNEPPGLDPWRIWDADREWWRL